MILILADWALKKFLVPAIASILILGSVGMIPQSFAGALEDCAFHIVFAGSPQLVETFQEHADCPDGVFNTSFPVQIIYVPPLPPGFTSSTSAADQVVHLEMPNFIDDFNTKTIEVRIEYDPNDRIPIIQNIKPKDQDACIENSSSISSNNGLDVLTEIWTCHPNPDHDRIWIDIGSADVRSVVVWTVSFDRNAVGGDIIPLDTTMVLVAGSQNTAAWMIPVLVSAIGIGIVIARKF